ncbi:conserved hypothetical protein [Xanthomonas phaseoli pv. phaseoli]|nr:conserved hypothetical protein [Xanthomonas phaseoli pv. phaseoli]
MQEYHHAPVRQVDRALPFYAIGFLRIGQWEVNPQPLYVRP